MDRGIETFPWNFPDWPVAEPPEPFPTRPEEIAAQRGLLRSLIERPDWTRDAADMSLTPELFTGPRRPLAARVLDLTVHGRVDVAAIGEVPGLAPGESQGELERVLEAPQEDFALMSQVSRTAHLLAASRARDQRGQPGLRGLPVLLAEEVKPREIEWLWQDRIALGKLAILEGDGGQGKTTLALDLAARLSRGIPLPGERSARRPASTVYVSYEDDESLLRDRIAAAGGDLSRVALVGAGKQGVAFPADLSRLEETIRRHGAGLVVIDPLAAALGPGYSAGSGRVREVLVQLAALAERVHAAVLLMRHYTKVATASAIRRGEGSTAIAAVARTVLAVDPLPGSSGRVRLSCTKSNLGPPPAPLFYAIERAGQGSRIVWLPEDAVADAFAASEPGPFGPAPTRRREAEHLLREALAGGPRKAADVYALAGSRGIAKRTLRRAAAGIGIAGVRSGPGALWTLPATES